MKRKTPSKGGFEYDIFSGWRKVLCYAQRAGVPKKAKKKYNKRDRKLAKQELTKEMSDE